MADKLQYGRIIRMVQGAVEIQATFWQPQGTAPLDQALKRLAEILAEDDAAAISPKDPRPHQAGNGEQK